MLRAYTRAFEAHPHRTQALVSGALMMIGDGGAQFFLTSEVFEFDFVRNARFAAYGSVFGVLSGKWNHWLEVSYPLKPQVNTLPLSLSISPDLSEKSHSKTSSFSSFPKSKFQDPPSSAISIPNLGKRVAYDQLLMAPISLFVFLTVMGILDQHSPTEIIERIKKNYFPILLTSYQIWPLWQLMVFRFVPLRFRIPVGAVAGIFWSGYLSFKAESKVAVAV